MGTFTADILPRLWAVGQSGSCECGCDVVISTVKSPLSQEDFVIDWTAALNGDTIAKSAWDLPPDLGLESSSFANTVNAITGLITSTATAMITGGVLGQIYLVVNLITTVTSKTVLQQNLQITILNC
jgi:hypothetical protein